MILGLILLGLMVSLSAAAVRRQGKTDRVKRFGSELRRRHVMQALYLSKLDRSFVAFDFEGREVILGDDQFERAYPFAALREVAVERAGDKGRLKSLSVRVVVDDEERPVHHYRIFAWPTAFGPRDNSPQVVAMTDQAGRIEASLREAMAKAA